MQAGWDSQSIGQLLADIARRKESRRLATLSAKPEPVRLEPRPSRRRSRRCACGVCPVCIDNAKWERVFREKFEDSSYYFQPTFRHNSPLS